VIDREALARNERPYALSYWPSGRGERPSAGPSLSDRTVQLTTFKRAANSDDFIIRLFEPTGKRRTTTVTLPCAGVRTRVELRPFEIKTLRIAPQSGEVREVNLLEQ